MPQSKIQCAAVIAAILTTYEFAAVTLSGGYAVRRDGTRYAFEPCRARVVKRNKQGRCVKLIGTYYDGSAIKYTWTEKRGPRYAAVPYQCANYPDNED